MPLGDLKAAIGMLASDGVVMVAITVDAKTGQPVGQPDLVSRGFLSDPDDPLMREARDHLLEALQQQHRFRPDVLRVEVEGGRETFVKEVVSRFDESLVRTIAARVVRNQYKRLPPVIAKLSHRSISHDFRYLRDITPPARE